MMSTFTKIAGKGWNAVQETILAAMIGGATHWGVAVLLYGQGIVGSFALVNLARSGAIAGLMLGVCRGIKPLGVGGSAIAGILASLVVWASNNLVPIIQQQADIADSEHLNAYFMYIFPGTLIAGLITGSLTYFISKALRRQLSAASGKQIEAHGQQETQNG